MPKRKYKDKRHHIESKIRRLQGRLERCTESSDDEDNYDYEYDRYYQAYSRPLPLSASDSEGPILPLSDSDNSIMATSLPQSVIVTTNTAPITLPAVQPPVGTTTAMVPPVPESSAGVAGNLAAEPTPSTSTQTLSLSHDILEALGEPKRKEEVYGPKIPEEISERWGRVLVDGLTKEQKEKWTDIFLIPDNFRFAKAPRLNPEIISVLGESARYRDKLMEKSQNQLGLGIAELSNLTSTVIRDDIVAKLDILKKISDLTQIFLDLHHEDTKRRRKLVTSSLDKKFLHVVADVKRDEYLFGTNLGDKIKACKTAERSGLQIKRTDATTSYSTNKRYPHHQGNWRGPPRTQSQPARRQGGPRGRYAPPQSRRPPPASERPPRPPFNNSKARRP